MCSVVTVTVLICPTHTFIAVLHVVLDRLSQTSVDHFLTISDGLVDFYLNLCFLRKKINNKSTYVYITSIMLCYKIMNTAQTLIEPFTQTEEPCIVVG